MNELRLDLDQKFSPCRWAAWCDRAVYVLEQTYLTVDPDMVRVRETDKGFHVYLPYTFTLPDVGENTLTDTETVAVQALLGSDWVRESINLRRTIDLETDWNILFTSSRRPGGPTNIEVPSPVKERMLRDALRSRQQEKQEEQRIAQPTPARRIYDETGRRIAVDPARTVPGTTPPNPRSHRGPTTATPIRQDRGTTPRGGRAAGKGHPTKDTDPTLSLWKIGVDPRRSGDTGNGDGRSRRPRKPEGRPTNPGVTPSPEQAKDRVREAEETRPWTGAEPDRGGSGSRIRRRSSTTTQ